MRLSIGSAARTFPALVALSLLVGVGAGCGSSANSICADVCDCIGCSETEQEDCVDSLEDAEKAAADDGCEDAYAEYESCISDELECREDRIEADGCDAEAEALAECGSGSPGGFGVNVCERASEICGGGNGGEDVEIECTGSTLCAANCIVDANSCDFSDGGDPLVNCVTDCSS